MLSKSQNIQKNFLENELRNIDQISFTHKKIRTKILDNECDIEILRVIKFKNMVII